MDHKINISVIIPSYNSEKTIFESIKSVQNQTYPPREIIIVDDGSIDNTFAVVESTKQESNLDLKYFKIINAGPSTARNFGVNKSKYEYIAFLDADDIWDENKLKFQVETLISTNAKAVSCQYLIFENNTNKKVKLINLDWNIKNIKKWIFLESYGALLPSTLLIERQIFLDVGGYREDLHFAEDADLAFRVLSEIKVVKVDKPLVLYRLSASNLHKQIIHNSNEYKNLAIKLKYLSEIEKSRLLYNVDVYSTLQKFRNLNIKKIWKIIYLILINPVQFFFMIINFIKRNIEAKINLKRYDSN